MADILDEVILPRLEEWLLPLDGRQIRLEGEALPSQRAKGGPVVRYRVVIVEPRNTTTTKKGQPAAPSYVDVAGALSGYIYDYDLTGQKNRAGVVLQTPTHIALRAKRLELLARRASAAEYISEMEKVALGATAKVVGYKATARDGHTYDSYYIELQ